MEKVITFGGALGNLFERKIKTNLNFQIIKQKKMISSIWSINIHNSNSFQHSISPFQNSNQIRVGSNKKTKRLYWNSLNPKFQNKMIVKLNLQFKNKSLKNRIYRLHKNNKKIMNKMDNMESIFSSSEKIFIKYKVNNPNLKVWLLLILLVIGEESIHNHHKFLNPKIPQKEIRTPSHFNKTTKKKFQGACLQKLKMYKFPNHHK